MNKIFKLFALAMILCVGFFTGCEDINTSNKYESGEKTITISGEYVNEQSGYVAIYVDIPEGVDSIVVDRGDILLGAVNYIDYSIFEGQELAAGQHVIKDYYISAGKSYKYNLSFWKDYNTYYKSQVLTVTVPEEIEKNNDFSNISATDINLAWDKEHHSFKWTFGEHEYEPHWINMPERNFEIGDNDNSYCYLAINYGVKDNGSYPVSIGSSTGWLDPEKMPLNENTIGKTFSVSSIIIRCEYHDLGRAANNEPYCIYRYEKEVPIGSPIGSYPQSISFPSEQEYIAQFEGTWVAPDLETITFNADGSYSTQPSPFTDRTPLNSSGQAGVVYDNNYNNYDLSINGYNFKWEDDTKFTEDEMRYDVLGMYDSSHSRITNLIKKQETSISFRFYSFQVSNLAGGERLCEIYFNENNECIVYDGSGTATELYRGTYSVDGNTVTMKDSNNDVRFTAVVSESGTDHYCYKTDSGEYIVNYW